jgi:hypothetical protein
MKLIDLLVRELPKRGGWPDGATRARQSSFDTEIYITNEGEFVDHKNTRVDFGISCTDCKMWANDVVTKEQYQSALSALQKVEWSGDGLPPVGCECEYLDSNGLWYPVTIKYASEQLVVISVITKILGVEQGTEIAKDIIIDKPKFRQLRSEADKKRDAAIDAIDWYMPEFIPDIPNEYYHAKKIYDAIAAGKIPGVKLED